MTRHWLNILAAAVLLAAVLAVSEFTELDMAVQARLYDAKTASWPVDKKDEGVLRAVVYHGVKILASVLGGGGAVAFVGSLVLQRLRPYRAAGLRVALALALVPMSVAGLKKVSNVYTPDQVFDGRRPHVKPFHRTPAEYGKARPGAGWPGGHASAGLSMMVFFYVLPGRGRWWALAGANVLGWAGAAYQMLNGEHFLTHAMVTWSLAWILIHLIVMATAKLERAPAPAEEARLQPCETAGGGR